MILSPPQVIILRAPNMHGAALWNGTCRPDWALSTSSAILASPLTDVAEWHWSMRTSLKRRFWQWSPPTKTRAASSFGLNIQIRTNDAIVPVNSTRSVENPTFTSVESGVAALTSYVAVPAAQVAAAVSHVEAPKSHLPHAKSHDCGCKSHFTRQTT